MRVIVVAVFASLTPLSSVATAQSIDVMGARAAGMAGAFVGVADDASAAYWNPGGLAAGSYFSLVLDGGVERAIPEDSIRGRKQSSFFLGATIPALGLTYYRMHRAFASPFDLLVPTDGAVTSRNVTGAAPVRLDSLVTHHAGITLVQSVLPNVAVGTTLKLVRGVASSEDVGFVSADEALDREDSPTRGTTKLDADIGIMASLGALKAGVTFRNVREPSFGVPGSDRVLKLERQARAGVSYLVATNLLVAGDLDLLETSDAFGDRRDAAFGIEGRLHRRLTLRSGVRFNLAGDDDESDDTDRAFAAGASIAATGSVFVDAAAVMGGDRGGQGWRVAARFVY